MINSLKRRALERVNLAFPEKQIYIRTDGRVQFFTLSPPMQAMLAGAAILFFGWVAFTSVNVIFKDRILAAKGRHFDQMQVSYESRLADLQLSYEELNSALVRAEDRFKAIADDFEAKQNALAALLTQKATLKSSLATAKPPAREPAPFGPNAVAKPGSGMGGAFNAILPHSAAPRAPTAPAEDASPAPKAAPRETETQQTSAAPGSAAPSWSRAQYPAFFAGAMQKLAALFQRRASSTSEHPLLRGAASQSARIVRLGMQQPALLAEATLDLDRETSRLTRAFRMTGIDIRNVMRRVPRAAAQGGPFIPMDSLYAGGWDDEFSAGLLKAASAMEQLNHMVAVLNTVPLAMPVENGSVSSGFGSRIDPFNERLAFHSGLDFSAPWGSDVRATAPGLVVFTGRDGAYGNAVEIDHGNGFRTRYAHLSRITAQVGMRVERGAVVGRLGSTGRSTGPHLHYEVWYDSTARDPSRFIKAGHNVLQE